MRWSGSRGNGFWKVWSVDINDTQLVQKIEFGLLKGAILHEEASCGVEIGNAFIVVSQSSLLSAVEPPCR